MAHHKNENQISRRAFLGAMRCAPVFLLPAPIRASPLASFLSAPAAITEHFPFADLRLAPHYPVKSPLDDVLRHVIPGADEFPTEKHALEISQLLAAWSRALRASPPALDTIAKFIAPAIESTPLTPAQDSIQHLGAGLDVRRRQFANNLGTGRDPFLQQLKRYFSELPSIHTAEFEILGLTVLAGSPLTLDLTIRYNFVGTTAAVALEERIGHWSTHWSRHDSNAWQATRWQATEEIVTRAREPIFIDVTSHALGHTASYQNQLLHGTDYWRTVLDAASGIDVYGNNGIAAGDFDNDGFDDLYICQPSGLPNRLYRNRGDGTFEDLTEKSGLGVLDATACALFADFENKGLQDLLVVCGSGPLLFLNQGDGKFALKRDAFQFARPPQGAFTHAALADYDADGRLDIYFCLYSYYLGLDQYHYPAPYFDARNGPPNFLMHNEGGATFIDRTEAAGLNVDNDRYSFACAWGPSQSNGRPDLYVSNDFGRPNLYRNNGDATFTSIASDAAADDPGAGMSAAWLDFDNDGKSDIYSANMWSAAGLRISQDPRFHEADPENIRALYRQHAAGNSLYRNLGNGKFQNVSKSAGVALGRWAWSSDSFDFDHDGYPDLYIANGYISGPQTSERDAFDLSSFFWRQVVAKSPQNSIPSRHYEQGWNAINELIRSDASWNGYERNVLYANNRDGTFSEVSGAAGLDFPDDSRAFALADLDHDGRLEIILKNRNAPQIRILRNVIKDLGASIAFRLRGKKSNRDAIGASITVEAAGLRQTKYLQAGSGFLSQHSKELFFGLGKTQEPIRASIHWPSGLTQSFERLPVNRRIEIQEGSPELIAQPFSAAPAAYARPGDAAPPESLPNSVETWLIEPLNAPDFSLPDLAGKIVSLAPLRGRPLLLHFCSSVSPLHREQLAVLRQISSSAKSSNLQILAINLDDPANAASARAFAAAESLPFPVLLATPEVAAIYNIFYRYLFDRRRDLPIPTSLLVNEDAMIVKVYQGALNPQTLLADLRALPRTAAERLQKALPLGGTLYQGAFQRNDFTYGVALFQRGYLDQAASSFRQVIAAKPNEPEAYYNLGTLYLRKNEFSDARRYLEQTVKLRPDYPEAWNNLGMIAAHDNQPDEAIRNFQQSLQLRPNYAVALLNLGNVYRRQQNFTEAEKLLKRALEIEPDNPEANYSVGMLYARQEQLPLASQYLQKAVELRPDYPDALNNLGVFFVRERRYPEAREKFETCVRVAPGFDQAYLNLARLYVILNEKQKAREVLQALLKQQPQHKLAQQALEMLN